jgi:hypothetical protein
MERSPEHLTDDPFLREEFISQESFDEWMERMCMKLEEQGQTKLDEKLRADDFEEAVEIWQRKLDPNTNMMEVLYLRGHTDISARLAIAGQMHARLREAAQDQGFFEIEPVEGIQEFNLGEVE